MRKNPGFTLIELMVVMAIIAILATAGLSAYTGYIKKARDATRIADVSAINTIIIGSLSVNGNPPANMVTVVTAANNGQMLADPLGTTAVCLDSLSGDTLGACGYTYSLCDGGNGYLITAKFESKSNQSSYTTVDTVVGYNVGTCTTVGGGGLLTNNELCLDQDNASCASGSCMIYYPDSFYHCADPIPDGYGVGGTNDTWIPEDSVDCISGNYTSNSYICG